MVSQAPHLRSPAFDASGYFSERTIVALSTPPGGALAIVRVSGSDAHRAVNALLSLADQERTASARVAHRVTLTHQGRKIDDAILIRYLGNASFTGEDTAELTLHGSPIIAENVIQGILGDGARLAQRGEFSFRAVKNGKLKLTQAEAIGEVIAATNESALEVALEKLSGSEHRLIEELDQTLMQAVTLSELAIDFADQDVESVGLPALKSRVKVVQEKLERLQGSFDRGRRMMDGITLALFGLPNAGKSSLFNALLGEDRAIVSSIAGTTRDVLREKLNLRDASGALTFKLADTAGVRSSLDQIEKLGVERSNAAARDADLVLLVIDAEQPNVARVQEILSTARLGSKPLLGVVTKEDLSLVDLASLKDAFPSVSTWVQVSSVTLGGIADLAKELMRLGRSLVARTPQEVVLTKEEHLQAVIEAQKELFTALQTDDAVLFAAGMRHARAKLAPLLGFEVADDVLARIFSQFCIGK